MTNETSIWTGSFWKAAAERAISTAAQAGIAYLGTAGLLDAVATDWAAFGSIAAGGAVLSVLKSLAVNGATNGSGPSLVKDEVVVNATTGLVRPPKKFSH